MRAEEQEEKGEGMIQNIKDKSLFFSKMILSVIIFVVPASLLVAFLEALSYSLKIASRMKTVYRK